MTGPPPAEPVARERLDPDEVDAVRALADRATAADGVAPFSEPTVLDLRAAGATPGTAHLLLGAGDRLAGYAHVDARAADDVIVELAVDPGHRERGAGTALVTSLRAHGPAASATTRAWAHGDHPGASRLAARAGLRRARELWMMRREPSAGPLPAVPERAGVRLRALRPGADEPAVVRVNGRAFAWHPEQGHLDLAGMQALEAESWFDPDGLILAEDEVSGDLLGFHWTKVHPPSPAEPRALGEVYVLGVDPDAQGRGLGGLLTLAGLHHLADRGLDTVILYVEGDNAAAIATYRRLGFARAAVDVSYEP